MTWARLDDSFWRNPKIRALTPQQAFFYVAAISYSADQLTDGLLDDQAVRMITASVGLRHRKVLLRVLLDVGLLSTDGERYVIHDYLEYNPSKADVLARRQATAERVKRHRNAVTERVSNSVSNGPPDPTLEEQPLKVGSSRDVGTKPPAAPQEVPPPAESTGRKPQEDGQPPPPKLSAVAKATQAVINALWQDPHRRDHLQQDFPTLTPLELDELDKLGANLERGRRELP